MKPSITYPEFAHQLVTEIYEKVDPNAKKLISEEEYRQIIQGNKVDKPLFKYTTDKLEFKPSEKNKFNIVAAQQSAKLIKESIEGRYCPMLPDKNGIIKGQPIINAGTGLVLSAKDLITAQIKAKQENYIGNVVGSYLTAQKAKTQIKAGKDKGIYSHFSYIDKTTGNKKSGNTTLHFSDQMKQPERLNDLASTNNKEKMNLKDMVFHVNTVTDYIPTYFAACKNDAKMEVSPELAKQFEKQMLLICNNELKESKDRISSIPNLTDVMSNADEKAKEIIKSVEIIRAAEKSRSKSSAEQAILAPAIKKPHKQRNIEQSMER